MDHCGRWSGPPGKPNSARRPSASSRSPPCRPACRPRHRHCPGNRRTSPTSCAAFAEQALAAAVLKAEEIAPGLLIDTDMLNGATAEAISDSGSGAQLLVVGDRGMSGFAALILGSVSRYVAAHAPCPAIIVRTDAPADANEVHGEIVVGVRDIRQATEAVAFAFEEAALRGAGLVASTPSTATAARKQAPPWPKPSTAGGTSSPPSSPGRRSSAVTPARHWPSTPGAPTSSSSAGTVKPGDGTRSGQCRTRSSTTPADRSRSSPASA